MIPRSMDVAITTTTCEVGLLFQSRWFGEPEDTNYERVKATLSEQSDGWFVNQASVEFATANIHWGNYIGIVVNKDIGNIESAPLLFYVPKKNRIAIRAGDTPVIPAGSIRIPKNEAERLHP